MRITLLWPFGRYRPGDVVEVDPRIGAVMIGEAFARPPGAATALPQPKAVTLADLQAYAADHGCSLTEARDLVAEAPHSGPLTEPATQEAPSCA